MEPGDGDQRHRRLPRHQGRDPRHAAAGGGSIINISSICGIVGSHANAAYHASKGAVRIFSKAAAIQYAPEKIRVNSVHPGFVDTPMTKPGHANPEVARKRMEATPLGRFGTPARHRRRLPLPRLRRGLVGHRQRARHRRRHDRELRADVSNWSYLRMSNSTQAGRKLAGKVALITGGARGLGRAYALRLAGLGADIAIVDRNLKAADVYEFEKQAMRAPTVMAECEALGVRAIGLEADLTSRAATFKVVDDVARRSAASTSPSATPAAAR